MRQMVARTRGGPEVLEMVEVPSPEPGPDQVRVRVEAAGVLLADVLWQMGIIPGSPRPPFTPGYDVVGVIDATGSGVRDRREGDRVAAMIQYGGYAEAVCVAAARTVPVPPGLDPAEAVCLTVNYVTAYQILRRVAGLSTGAWALIHGAAGGTGSAFLDVSRLMGVRTIGTASAKKHDLLTRYGAVPIDYQWENFVEEVFKITPDGVDLAVDPIGGDVLPRSFRVLRRGGMLVSTAFMSAIQGSAGRLQILGSLIRLPLWNLLPNGKAAQMFDVVAYNRANPAHYAEDLGLLMEHLGAGRISPVLADQMPLAQAADAQRLLLGSKVQGKIVLTP